LKRAILCCSQSTADTVYAMGRQDRLRAIVDLYPHLITEKTFEQHADALKQAEVMFATWNIPKLTPLRYEMMPKLKAIFYAAGTVRMFAESAIERRIRVVSAWRMNAVPVAEFTLAQILLSMKGYFANVDAFADKATHKTAPRGPGNFEQTVALLGAGAIGRKLIELLRPFRLNVVVFDPFLKDVEARELGVEKVSLEEAFARAHVISNHLANVPDTVGLLGGDFFRSMRPGATFINTGRGAQVNESELMDVLRTRHDLYALLDVTQPEPPAEGSPLYTLPNVRLSTHIAGSIGGEVIRMADLMIEEFLCWQAGLPLQHEVTLDMLEHMA
jgi:phosphoglycerate dehydrogenase-like enzyme